MGVIPLLQHGTLFSNLGTNLREEESVLKHLFYTGILKLIDIYASKAAIY